MKAPPPSQYIHGTDPDEQARLSLLNDLLNRRSLGELHFVGGERILDVGSGLGQLARGMARAAGAGAVVVGVERSPEQLAEARRLAADVGEGSLVDFRHGDALDLPLRPDEWGTFDVAHTRFLLEHVPDSLAVVKAMVRAVRPGGRVILEDDAHDVMRLHPEPPGFRPLWEAYMRAYDRLGNDALIGHRLVSLLWQTGAAPVRNAWLFFGACAGDGQLPAFVANLIGVIEGARAAVVANGLLSAESFDESIASLHRWGERPDAAIWYALAWAEGRRDAAAGLS